MTDPASIAAAADRIDREEGVLDILVNNAGIVGPVCPPSQTQVPDMRKTYETNVFGVVAVTNAMLPLPRRSRAGRIVNLTSDLGSLTNSVATDQNGHRGVLTPDQGAKLPIRMATLPADGPTGIGVTADTDLTQHPLPW